MAKIHVCDYCEIRLGEVACSNSIGGSYCSVRCANTAESEANTSPKTTDDIIANLVARVAKLEQRDESQRRHNGVLSQRIAELSQRINGTHRDIETWAQDHSELAHKVARIADKQFNHGLNIGRIDDKIEMCIDDIVALDERTQPQTVTLSIDTLEKLIGGVCG